MVIPKSDSRMDYWREYFGSANVDIFEIIERAIVLAASDFPKEFKTRRDGIAQILFSSRLIKCSGCNKEELALPVDNQEHDDHNHDHHGGGDEIDGVKYKSKLADDGNRSKESSKVINCSRINGDDDDDNDDDGHVQLDEMNNQVSNYSYGEAEALTDAIEQESQMFDEVLRIKEIVDNSQDQSASTLCNSLRKLQYMALSIETLKTTEIGISVNGLRRHSSNEVRQIAISLINVWKGMVDEWMTVTSKPDVPEATPESMNPSVLDEEEGLPSPPLDDLGFLDSHSMPLELSEKFFDGMDDNGNPTKNGESNKAHDSGKPTVEKQNVTKWKQPKPSNRTTTILKEDRDSKLERSTIVKPIKPPVTHSTPGRQMKPNMDRKLQSPEKPTPPKKAVVPPQRNPRPSNEETVQDKLEATKRKLQERYQEAEKAKRQRTIQVMELHDLPKQSVMRPGNNHNRHWVHGRY